MAAELVLGVDLGTSAVKVAAVAPNGAVAAAVRLPLRRPGPAAWWSAAARATRSLVASGTIAGADIAAIGLSGRGGSTVLSDARGRALAAAGLQRAIADEARVQHLQGPMRRLRPLVSHVLRSLDADPSLARRLRRVLAAKDTLALRLTGEAVTDPASGPDMLHWPLAELAACGFPIAALPEVRLPWDVAGRLTPAAATALGLRPGILVTTGAHDGVAAQIGAGMLRPGEAALTLGTHAVLRVVTDVPAGNVRFRFYSLWGDRDPRQVFGGNARLGGASLAWFAQISSGDTQPERLLPQLEREAGRVPAGSDGVLFLPFLGGMFYPEQRYAAQGAFLGLQMRHGRGHLYRAVLEGVAFAVRNIDEALKAGGILAGEVRLTGGGARSVLWRQILADVLGRPLGLSAAPGFEECIGAARCAWVGLGRFADIDTAVAAGLPPQCTVSPALDPDIEALEANYRRYRAAADAVWQWQQADGEVRRAAGQSSGTLLTPGPVACKAGSPDIPATGAREGERAKD